MEKTFSVKELPFSVYTRYQALSESIEALRQPDQVFKILEVGGRGNFLKHFVPKDSVTILDVIDSDEENYVKGDGRSLPFKKGQFDLVVSTDVLEHIPVKDRKKFLEEKIRVANTAVILAGPIYSKDVATKESEANKYYKDSAGNEHPWLVEHLEYGLPTQESVEEVFSKNKCSWSVWHNQQIDLWFELVMVDMAVAAFGTNKVLSSLKQINKTYNQNIYPFDRSKNGYRWVYTAMTNSQEAPPISVAKSFNDLPVKSLLDLTSEITKLMRQIEEEYRFQLLHANSRGAAVEELSQEVNRLRDMYHDSVETNRQLQDLSNDYQAIKARLERIESTNAYKLYRRYKKLLSG